MMPYFENPTIYSADLKLNSTALATRLDENDDNFSIPLPAIILLGILGFCLIVIIILYLVLRRNANKLMDKASGHGRRKTIPYEPGVLRDEEDWDNEEEMLPVISENDLDDKQDPFYALPPIRTAVLVVSVTFSSRIGRLFVEIIQLEALAKEIVRYGLATSLSIHARLQPLPDQFRHKTTSKPISRPIFNERFAFDGFRRRDLEKCWFRFRIYANKAFTRDKLLGEVNVGVTEFEVDGIWSTLNLDIVPSEEVHRLIKK